MLTNLFLSVDSDFVDEPLLVLGRVVDGLVFTGVVRQVEFVSVKRPRDEDDVAFLVVKREMLYVERAVGLDDGWEHPQHLTARRHDSERVHEVLEAVVSATNNTTSPAHTHYSLCDH